jgi:hypothetical protein
VLTPIRPVRIGISKHFVFESAGRWGCDLKGWTKGADRFLWDIHVSLAGGGLFLLAFVQTSALMVALLSAVDGAVDLGDSLRIHGPVCDYSAVVIPGSN